MNLFHLVLSNASPLAIFQLYPAFCSLPLFLEPWGFQFNACLSIIPCGLPSLWSIQRHFLSFICCSVGVSCVLCQNSSFEILSSHLTFNIPPRHKFTNTWIEFHIQRVILHVSRPFKGLIQNFYYYNRILFLAKTFLFHQTWYNCTKAP